MNKSTIHIYISPSADIESYPDSLLGDMSVFKEGRSIQHEVQWILYLMLKDRGMDVRICREFPDSGILVIHKSHVKKFAWSPDLFVVSLQWDYKRDDRAQMHLVSSQYKTTREALGRLDRLSFAGLQHYIDPVMHPVIQTRDPERGDRFENVAFIGDPKNLDEAFRTPEFEEAVKQLGMNFIIRSDPGKMSDYSDIDVVIAIRKIGTVITNKPATKLFNAWRGGVPSLLGCEIGFREARESEFDYLEVDSVQDVLAGLERLKNDQELRRQMISNGNVRGEPFSAEGQRAAWVSFFKDTVLPAAEEWNRRSSAKKLVFLLVRRMRYQMRLSLSFIRRRLLKRSASDFF